MLELRPYQDESIEALFEHWGEGGGNALIVIPTGGGKSLIIAFLLQKLFELHPLMRVGIVTHTQELIVQNFKELIGIWPSAPVGIYSAGIGRRDTRAAILFMGIQSVWDKTQILGKFDLLIVDEADLISRNAQTMYGKFFDGLRGIYDGMRVVGLTATPYRLDSGRLDQGDDKIFEKIIYEANVADLIRDGYLSRLVSKGGSAEISTRGVHRRGGEFIAGELERAAMQGDLVKRAASEIVSYGNNRKAWLAFCSGVDHALAVRDALRGFGVNAETITGDMPKHERNRFINEFREGRIKALTSVNVLSVGFNVPHVDLIALLRPTASARLYVQQVGRGFRLAHGKENCLILDFAGNVARHGPIDMVEDNERQAREIGDDDEAEEGGMLAKVCPNCKSLVHIRIMECPDCGHIWDAPAKHEAQASTLEILSNRTPDGYLPVNSIKYMKHHSGKRFDAPPTLRVLYYTPRKVVNEWLCFSHPQGSRAQHGAASFWLQMGGGVPVPASVDDAILRSGELREIESIKFENDGDFDRVKGRRFLPKRLEGAA